MKKASDCVKMKWLAQEKIYMATRGLTRAEGIEYFRAAGDRFWREIEAVGAKRPVRKDRKRRVG
jgi:hypothetical protein